MDVIYRCCVSAICRCGGVDAVVVNECTRFLYTFRCGMCYVGGWLHGVSGMCIAVSYAGGAWRVVMCRYRDDVQRLCVVMGMFIWSIV